MSSAFISEGDIYITGEISAGISPDPRNFTILPAPVKFADVSIGDNILAAIDMNGNIWTFVNDTGYHYDEYDQEGYYDEYETGKALREPLIQSSYGQVFTAVSCGVKTTFALDNDGKLWVKGSLYTGRGGFVSSDNFREIITETRFRILEVSGQAGALIDFSGNLWCFGLVEFGYFYPYNINDNGDPYAPRKVNVDSGFVSVSCGGGFLTAIDDGTNLWVYFPEYRSKDAEFKILLTNIQKVVCGSYYIKTIDIYGNVWIGSISASDRSIRDYEQLTQNISITQIVDRDGESLIMLDNDKMIYVFGDNTKGQLGLGYNVSKVTDLMLLEGITADTLSDQNIYIRGGLRTKSASKIN